MSIAEQIYALVKSLPQEQASEVLTFVEFVRHKERRSTDAIDPQSWEELVFDLAGSWADDFPSLEDIRGAGQDVQRESL
jgi:hypothetical protein